MLYHNVRLEAYGYELPEFSITSEELERRISPLYDRLNLAYGRLELISGIKERRYWEEGSKPSRVSALAGEKAIRSSGISREEIGCLIHSSVSRDFFEPATASMVHRALRLPDDCNVFDVSNACLGFVNSLIIIANMIESGQIKAGLVVAGESSNSLMNNTVEELNDNRSITRKDLKDHFTSLTIGSGAVALVLTHASISRHNHKLIGGSVYSDTSHNDCCIGGIAKDGKILMRTNSVEVMENGVKLAAVTWRRFKKELDWENETADRIFCHQAGTFHRKMLYETLELDINKDFSTLEYLGNTGSVGLPVTMAVGIEKGLVKTGDNIALLGIGTGLNCIMLGVEW
ncbi:MAG: 3-oxoacyl-ACP synthase III [bacterium]